MALERMIDRFRLRVSQRREARVLKRQKEEALAQAIDRVVQVSAPVVCSLRDCRRDLRSPVDNALRYIDQTIDAIPGPVSLSPEKWDQDPLLKALFVTPDEVSYLLVGDPRLKPFFAQPQAARAFALLTATKVERTIFAPAVEGEIVRRDVPQTAVEFHDLRILDPAATEAATRFALKDRALNALVAQVLERLLQIRALKDELKEHQRILSIQLKIQQTRTHSLDELITEDREAEPSAPAGLQVLADIDRQIQDLGKESDSPADYLRQLMTVLNAPQEVLTVVPVAMRLNWMGVRQNDASGACDRDICLAEVKLQNRLRRVAVVVSINRKDYLR
ncbi:MAG: hypothetical protein ACM3KE_13015 [Hyphomicrobiales bacterium]